ncbi:MAG TPA: VOC family protein [Candidatus Methylomirabilis sp.]|nr:VOC family protein [Candidatus Methylomirabilis sp.]
MRKRSPAEQLELAIDALLARPQRRPVPRPNASVAKLLTLVRPLRDLPRAEFKASLKRELHRRAFMSETAAASAAAAKAPQFRREDFPNIAPYFLVKNAPQFIDFLVSAFSGTERIRVPRPDGSIMHAEVSIGNSVIELGDASEQYPQRSMTTHLYVPDADATYAAALEAGATPVHAPTDEHPSGDRWGEAKDAFGNTWYIATPRGWTLGTPGTPLSVQPYLRLRGAHNMIPFIEAALGAKASGVHKSPEGIVHHATIEIAGATFEIDEAQGEPQQSYLHVYVPDTDALYARAVAAGARGVTPPYTAPYGDRAASISDPFGNTWFLATYLGSRQP